jgi:hypothetical protein
LSVCVGNDARHDESERTLATLGSLGADEYEATREAVVALVRAVLTIAASLTPTTEGTTP